VGGNIGTPLCSLVGESADWIVAELSSFQLEHAKRLHARVAVLLNLAPDHLDRHGSLGAYGAAKEQLTRLQGADDVLVLNADDPWAAGVGERTRAHVEQFSTQKPVESGAFLAGDDCVLRASEREVLRVSLRELSTACKSPVANALAALAAAHAAGASPQGMRRALAHFEGLPHRVQEICTRRGVLFVDDSKATNPAAAATSLAAQTRPVWWLAGGQNKGLDFAPLANASTGVRGAIVFGEAAQELGDALAEGTEVTRVHSLDEAVRDAAARATSGDVVLLAPACASYDAFVSFEERGDHFAELARALPC
jgi:UDP-N-acetylmuramoylalanine--D-glutamate ligase